MVAAKVQLAVSVRVRVLVSKRYLFDLFQSGGEFETSFTN